MNTLLLVLFGAALCVAQPPTVINPAMGTTGDAIAPACSEETPCDRDIYCNEATGFCEEPSSCNLYLPPREDAICNNVLEDQRFYGAHNSFEIRWLNTTMPPSEVVPRDVSNLIHAQPTSIPNRLGVSGMWIPYAQIVDHDTTFVLENEEDPAETCILEGPDGMEFTFHLSEFRTGPPNRLVFENSITAYIDGSTFYGSDFNRNTRLRRFKGGQLISRQVNGQEWPPLDEEGIDVILCGDIRCAEMPELLSLHTLWLREHNRLARLFNKLYDLDFNDPVDDEFAYQSARALVIAQHQNVVFNEWLPVLLGQDLPAYGGYDTSINAGIGLAFSGGAYRIGHTGVVGEVLQISRRGKRRFIPLEDTFFNPFPFEDNGGLDGVIKGAIFNCQERMDNLVVDALRDFLFFEEETGEREDLMVRNIKRARDHGLLRYHEYREHFSPSAYTEFTDINPNTCISDALYEAYDGDFEDCEWWPCGLSEEAFPPSQLGETFTRVIVDQFLRLREGDRFYFENQSPIYPGLRLTPAQIAWVRSTDLAQVIRRNTFLNGFPPSRNYVTSAFWSNGDRGCNCPTIGTYTCVDSGNGFYELTAYDSECEFRGLLEDGAIEPGTENDDGVFLDCDCHPVLDYFDDWD